MDDSTLASVYYCIKGLRRVRARTLKVRAFTVSRWVQGSTGRWSHNRWEQEFASPANPGIKHSDSVLVSIIDALGPSLSSH
jgi:hypothetical protein